MTCYGYIAVLLTIFHLINANQTSLQCGDWLAYKDEKCVKVFDTENLQNYSDAENVCRKYQSSNLVSIRSQEEQDFLYNVLKNDYYIANDVWIGGQYVEHTLKWSDNVTVSYINWAINNPINESEHNCVQISMDSVYNGKWLNEPCNKKNVVVCQSQQNWLVSYLQKTLMDLREAFEKYSAKTEEEIKNYAKLFESTTQLLENTTKELLKTKTDLQNTKTELTKVSDMATESSPIGTIAYFSTTKPPKGWLKANGQSLLRSEYANLFSMIGIQFGCGDGSTTFTLPDLRGEFIRGWSDGRDVDTNRAFASFQFGSSIPLSGYINGETTHAMSDAFHVRWEFAGQSFDNGFERYIASGETRDGITFPNDNVGNYVYYVNTTNQGYITSWNVFKGTRPRNIALLACIKY